ncbi:hypothetical protein AB0M28_14205 [Streptomyces sp. NPDC051940]|uniref:hypothetical protein n=1 Tax=Streptomyces sp. NPDC051940 TaxID=3155675 RepID=UPI00342194B9
MTTVDNEDQELLAILARLESIKPYETLTTTDSKGWEVQSGSPLAGDDRKAHPYGVSHLAWHALTVASDHLTCLRRTLIGDGDPGAHIQVTLHIFAQATLLRAAFENSCRAVWLLAPEKRLTRITRRLSLQAESITHSDRITDRLKLTPARPTAQRVQKLESAAIAAGIARFDLKKQLKFTGFKSVVRAAGDSIPGMGADQAEVVWSACSSLAHGDLHSMSFLDREVVSRHNNVALTRLSNDTTTLLWATSVSAQMLEHAVKLYEMRRTAP